MIPPSPLLVREEGLLPPHTQLSASPAAGAAGAAGEEGVGGMSPAQQRAVDELQVRGGMHSELPHAQG